MKKALLVLVTLALFLGVFPASFAAAGTGNLVLNGSSYAYLNDKGEYVLEVNLANNPGIYTIRANLEWDSNKFELVKLEKMNLSKKFTDFMVGSSDWDSETGEFSTPPTSPFLLWSSSFLATENITDNGTWVRATFKVKNGVQAGTTANFSIELIASYNLDGVEVSWTSGNKTVTITTCTNHTYNSGFCTKCGRPNYGDVNGDNLINDLDVRALARYLANVSPGNFIPETADVNGDGRINDYDLLYLSRHVAGWPGYEILGPQ